jgi:putative transposase
VFKTKSGVGIDAGVMNQMMLGDSWSGIGMQIRERVPVTKKLKHINRRFSKRKKGSEGRRAMRRRLNAEYRHITNTRRDIRNKLTSTKSGIPSVFRTIATQKDHISGWQTMWGTRVQTSAIGGMMAVLRSKTHTPIIVDRWTPNTQPCPKCGALQPDLKGLENLSNRTPECWKCGFRTDRDIWSAMNDSNQIPLAERKPVDMKTYTKAMDYFNSIPHVKASLMEIPTFETRGKEAESRQAPYQGSHPTLVGGL